MMRKSMLYLGLVEDDEDVYAHELDEPEPEPVHEPRRRPAARPTSAATSTLAPRRVGAGSALDSPLRPVPPASPVPEEPYRITTLHPRTYNEARQIGESFRSGTPVIMNLTEMDDGDAKRLVDFAAGLSFGLHGRIERVTNKVFLLSPEHVEVTAEDKARMAETGFFNQS